jgi:hypothetical protein
MVGGAIDDVRGDEHGKASERTRRLEGEVVVA